MPLSLRRLFALLLAAAGIGLALWLVPPLRAEPRRAAAVLALLGLGTTLCLVVAAARNFAARTWVRCVAVAAGGMMCGLVAALRYSVALETLPSVPLTDRTLRTELADWCNALDAVAMAAAYLTATFLLVPGPSSKVSENAPGAAAAGSPAQPAPAGTTMSAPRNGAPGTD